MMPDLGDVTVGLGDVRALAATVANIGVKRPPPWSVGIRQRARCRSSTQVGFPS